MNILKRRFTQINLQTQQKLAKARELRVKYNIHIKVDPFVWTKNQGI